MDAYRSEKQKASLSYRRGVHGGVVLEVDHEMQLALNTAGLMFRLL